jgi:hypothetical protein
MAGGLMADRSGWFVYMAPDTILAILDCHGYITVKAKET